MKLSTDDWKDWGRVLSKSRENRRLNGSQILSWLEDNFYPGWRIGAATYLQNWLLERNKPLLILNHSGEQFEMPHQLPEAVCLNWPMALSEDFIVEYRQSIDYRQRLGKSMCCRATEVLRQQCGNDYVNRLIDRVVEVRSAA